MARLSVFDTAFLAFESSSTPMHVGSLQVLQPPREQAEQFAGELHRQLLKKTEVVAPYNRRVKVTLDGLPHWVETPVDLSYHVRLHRLPKPGNPQQLQEMAAWLHTPVMDQSRPLWELHIIDGLADNKVAFYLKIHHCLVDGALFNRIMGQFYSTRPNTDELVPFWQQPLPGSRKSASDQAALDQLLKPLNKALKQAWTLPSMALLGSKVTWDRVSGGSQRLALPFTAPRSPFNRDPQPARDYALAAISMARLKQVARLSGASLNEVVLTLCDLALNRYLADQNLKLGKPMIAMVPIKRAKEATAANNDLTAGLVELGQVDATPAERLEAIMASSQTVKEEALTLSPNGYFNWSALAALVAVVGGKLKLTQCLPPACNLVISNVPGPQIPFYLQQARLEAAYPLSALGPTIALNITLYSYDGTLHFGLTFCRQALPGFARITGYLEQAMAALEKDLLAKASDVVHQQLDQVAHCKPSTEIVPESAVSIPEPQPTPAPQHAAGMN